MISSVTNKIMSPQVRQLPEAVLPHAAGPAFANLPGLALLESSQPGALGRYTYLTADPFLRLESVGDRITLQWRDRSPPSEVRKGQPFAVLRALLAEYAIRPAQDGPPFQGGAVGAFAYDLGRQLEEMPSQARNDVPTPEMSLGFYDWVLAHDHRADTSWLVTTGLPDRTDDAALARQAQVLDILADWQTRREERENAAGSFRLTTPLEPNVTREQYLAMVQRAQEYIAAGDVYQVNLSQRFAAGWKGSPWTLYERLQRESPVPVWGLPRSRR